MWRCLLERFGDKYAYYQLQKALDSGQTNKAGKWKKVFTGMFSGDLEIGSRTPIRNIPNWVTPDIVRGGFATGDLKAGGPLKPHETKLANDLSIRDKSPDRVRQALNNWHLSEDGFARLGEMLETGHYRAETSEELALLTICALAREHSDKGIEILSVIQPFFDRLRFYPSPADTSQPEGFYRQTVEDLCRRLDKVRPRASIRVQSNVLNVWIPIYDRLLDLLEYQGQTNWKRNAQALLKDVENLSISEAPRRWSDKDRPFRRCLKVLEQLTQGLAVSERDENYVQLVLSRHRVKYGDNNSKESFRAEQKQQDVDYWHDELANELMDKLGSLDPKSGISDPSSFIAGFEKEIPLSMARKVEMSRMGTLEHLIESGQINSQEVLAEFIPRVSAKVVAAGIESPAYQALYENLYRSFHERRSLLLLNLESQTRLDELPWAAALEKLDIGKKDISQSAFSTMSELGSLVLNYFPQTQFPNPMVEQFSALRKKSILQTPFVPELAADIFMGKFSKSFELAAKASNAFMKNTVYGRYFNLPDRINPGQLGNLCSRRANALGRQGGNWVAQNGTIIEQALILTSHNMANVLENLDLDVDFPSSVLKCFNYTIETLRHKQQSRYLELIALKNAAYAWRQMLALLTQLNLREQEMTFKAMCETLKEESGDFQKFMNPVVEGLEQSLSGDPVIEPIFLGWSAGPHPYSRH